MQAWCGCGTCLPRWAGLALRAWPGDPGTCCGRPRCVLASWNVGHETGPAPALMSARLDVSSAATLPLAPAAGCPAVQRQPRAAPFATVAAVCTRDSAVARPVALHWRQQLAYGQSASSNCWLCAGLERVQGLAHGTGGLALWLQGPDRHPLEPADLPVLGHALAAGEDPVLLRWLPLRVQLCEHALRLSSIVPVPGVRCVAQGCQHAICGVQRAGCVCAEVLLLAQK